MDYRPLIAIIGSVNEKRKYSISVRDPEKAKIAAQNLGKALAKKGYRILVYSGDPSYIECDVVRGFVEAGVKEPKSIVAVFALGQLKEIEKFPEYQVNQSLFELRQHQREQWRIPYIKSFGIADGIILIGGGNWTLTAGSCAIAFQRPLIALSAYGGESEAVWNYLPPEERLFTKEDKDVMALPGDIESNSMEWVNILEKQINVFMAEQQKTKAAEKQLANISEKRKSSNALSITLALIMIMGWVITLPIGDQLALTNSETSKVLFKYLLFLAPLLSGASGATIRMLMDPHSSGISYRTIVLGMAAGTTASTLYVLPQILTNPSPYSVYILGSAIIFGFVAGLTFDAVLKKLLTKEVPLTDLPGTGGNE